MAIARRAARGWHKVRERDCMQVFQDGWWSEGTGAVGWQWQGSQGRRPHHCRLCVEVQPAACTLWPRVLLGGPAALTTPACRRNNGYFIYSSVEGVSFQPRDVPTEPLLISLVCFSFLLFLFLSACFQGSRAQVRPMVVRPCIRMVCTGRWRGHSRPGGGPDGHEGGRQAASPDPARAGLCERSGTCAAAAPYLCYKTAAAEPRQRTTAL